jgi:hypothetical protein
MNQRPAPPGKACAGAPRFGTAPTRGPCSSENARAPPNARASTVDPTLGLGPQNPASGSTPAGHQILGLGPQNPEITQSGRRDSNSRRSAWKADALPTELLPRKCAHPGRDARARQRTAPARSPSQLVKRGAHEPRVWCLCLAFVLIRPSDAPAGRAFVPALACRIGWWRVLDSNQRRQKPAGLQPAPIGHSGNPPEDCLYPAVVAAKPI